MALLWMDGFDHYGAGATGVANMQDGVYAEAVGSGIGPNTANPRSGTHAYRIPVTVSDAKYFRRIFGADKTVVGVGYALYLDSLPVNSARWVLAEFRDNANAAQCSLLMTTTGQVELRRGTYTGAVIATSAPAITAAAYQHFECRVRIGDADGACEVRVNGATVLSVSNVDTKNTANAGAAQVAIGHITGVSPAGGGTWDIDDLFAWDDQGGVADDFLADHRVLMLQPDADTATTDWVRNAGADDFAAIDDAAPDDDTTYIAASAAADASIFSLADTPANVSAVTAVQMVGRLRKTDAGACNVQMSLLSSDIGSPAAPAEANGADRPITEVYTYWQDVVHNDPATGAPWTASALDAAQFKIERTA